MRTLKVTKTPARTFRRVITGFAVWLQGAATDADSCPFSCGTGYTVSGRTCTKAIPKMLALGKDSSRILFDNGEVEAWGKVSTSSWRSHIKEENLGSNTPQALVLGELSPMHYFKKRKPKPRAFNVLGEKRPRDDWELAIITLKPPRQLLPLPSWETTETEPQYGQVCGGRDNSIPALSYTTIPLSAGGVIITGR